MKDSEFIELLNLYLDREISPADAVRLEAEIAASPARRRVYGEYCRMHRACSLVGADFRSAEDAAMGTATNATAGAGEKILPFELAVARATARRRRVVGGIMGAMAAAACVAVALVGFRGVNSGSVATEAMAVSQPASRAESAVLAQAEPTVAVTSTAVVSSGVRELGVAALRRAGGAESPAMPAWATATSPLVMSAQQPEAVLSAVWRKTDDQFAWLQNVQFSPVQTRVPAEQIRFDARPVSLQPEGRALGGRVNFSAEPEVEMAAFRFVK